MIDNKDGTVTMSYTEYVRHLLSLDTALQSQDYINELITAAIYGGYGGLK